MKHRWSCGPDFCTGCSPTCHERGSQPAMQRAGRGSSLRPQFTLLGGAGGRDRVCLTLRPPNTTSGAWEEGPVAGSWANTFLLMFAASQRPPGGLSPQLPTAVTCSLVNTPLISSRPFLFTSALPPHASWNHLPRKLLALKSLPKVLLLKLKPRHQDLGLPSAGCPSHVAQGMSRNFWEPLFSNL